MASKVVEFGEFFYKISRGVCKLAGHGLKKKLIFFLGKPCNLTCDASGAFEHVYVFILSTLVNSSDMALYSIRSTVRFTELRVKLMLS